MSRQCSWHITRSRRHNNLISVGQLLQASRLQATNVKGKKALEDIFWKHYEHSYLVTGQGLCHFFVFRVLDMAMPVNNTQSLRSSLTQYPQLLYMVCFHWRQSAPFLALGRTFSPPKPISIEMAFILSRNGALKDYHHNSQMWQFCILIVVCDVCTDETCVV